MLMTFPTKESLLRNLNERDVSEVFLIIANFKSLAGWNLIPLRNLTILLGPNSAGKSMIYEAIEAIRDFDDDFLVDRPYGFRGKEDEEEPCFGFSMPFVLDGQIYSESMEELLLNALGSGVPITSLPHTHNEGVDGGPGFAGLFVLEDFLPGQHLYESLKSVRYTMMGLHDERATVKYEVYFNNDLASLRTTLGEHDYGEVYFCEITKIHIYPSANNLLYYPLMAIVRHIRQKKYGLSGDLKACIGLAGNLDDARDLHAEIMYPIRRKFGEKVEKLKEHLPFGLFDFYATQGYGSRCAAFSMTIALYHVCHHRFLEYTAGLQTEDVRTNASIEKIFKGLIDNEIIKIQKDLADLSDSDDLELSESTRLARQFIESVHYKNDFNRYLADHTRLSERLNRWLREKAFLDSPYQLKLSFDVTIPMEFLDEDLSIKQEIIEKFRRGKINLNITGRASLFDQADRELSLEHVGTGYSQVLPILLGLVDRSILVFRQPEVHLHPRLQSRVADCFVETVFNERQDKISRIRIIETHSEHFVLRLLRRLRESSFDELYHSSLTVYPEDVAFVYFQPQGDSTRVHEIAVLPSGEFVDGWPDGFFDERDEDLWGMPSPRGR
ncbi:MAG: DUF3696 domain-containing protein [Methylococcus sp.]